MADEKILEEEVLDNADLENVAGGNMKETFDDRTRLEKLGLYKFDKSFTKSVNNAFSKLSSILGADLKITSDSSMNKDTANKYFINDVEISRDEFWSVIEEGLAANKN